MIPDKEEPSRGIISLEVEEFYKPDGEEEPEYTPKLFIIFFFNSMFVVGTLITLAFFVSLLVVPLEGIIIFFTTPLLLLVLCPILFFLARLSVLLFTPWINKYVSVLLPEKYELDFDTGAGKQLGWFLIIEVIINFFCMLIYMFDKFMGLSFLGLAVFGGLTIFFLLVLFRYNDYIGSAKYYAYTALSGDLYFSYEDYKRVLEEIRAAALLGFLDLKSGLFSYSEIKQRIETDVQDGIRQFVLDESGIDHWPDRVVQWDGGIVARFWVWRRVSVESHTEAEEALPTTEVDVVTQDSDGVQTSALPITEAKEALLTTETDTVAQDSNGVETSSYEHSTMTIKRYYDKSVFIKKGEEWVYPSINPVFFDDEDVLEIDELPFGEVLSIEPNDIFCILTPALQKSSKLKVTFEIREEYQAVLVAIGSPSAFTGKFYAHTDKMTGKWRHELDYDVRSVKAWEVSGSGYLLWDVKEDIGQHRISLYNDSNEQITLELIIQEMIGKPSVPPKQSSSLEIGERSVIEREVLILPRIPNNCFNCGAILNPKNLEWASYNVIICQNCGSSTTVEFERI